jgi:FkbM family methyltransferase
MIEFIRRHPLTGDRSLSAIARYLRWQIRSRLIAESIVPFVDGSVLAVRRGMHGATGNIYFGLQEFEQMAFALHSLGPGAVFLDAGANVGSYTVLALARGSRVIACEPDPEAMTALRRNVELNSAVDRVKTWEVALGASAGTARLTIGSGTMNQIIGPHESGRDVQMLTADAVAGEIPVTLMKIDVECYEREVVRGAARLLQSPSLNAVIIEGDADDLLSAYGFNRCSYDPFGRVLQPISAAIDGTSIFVRDVRSAQRLLTEAPRFSVLDWHI